MNKLNKISLLLILSATLFSCSNNGKIDSRAQKLNDTALEILMNDMHLSDEKIDTCISLLDKSTEIYPDFYLAHWNKMIFLFKKKDYPRLLETNKILQNKKSFVPYLIVQEGMIQEIIGDSIKSHLNYKKGLKMYDSILSTDTSVDLYFKWERIQCLTISNQEELAREELFNLKKEFPENEMLKEYSLQTKKELLQEITKD